MGLGVSSSSSRLELRAIARVDSYSSTPACMHIYGRGLWLGRVHPLSLTHMSRYLIVFQSCASLRISAFRLSIASNAIERTTTICYDMRTCIALLEIVCELRARLAKILRLSRLVANPYRFRSERCCVNNLRPH